MLHSTFSKFRFIGGALAFSLSLHPLDAEEASTPIFIENHLAMANEHGELVAPRATNDEEAFLIRRIAEFWKDGDFRIVKMQIVEFFEKYPESSLKEYFLGILGDLYLQENNPTLALEAYEQIQSKDLFEKILINKLHCYYDLNRYSEIVEQGAPYLSQSSSEFAHRQHELSFLIAEGFFRQGLELSDTDPTKISLYEQSLPLYDSLQETAYKEVACFALAESHRILGNYQTAASLYNELAERYPEQKDDLLFQAGNLQAQFDQTAAIGTFSQIIEREGKYASEAQFNRLILLFKTEQYSSVLSDYEKVANVVPDESIPTYKYIVGKSYYAIDKFQEASAPLSEYIASQSEPSDQLKNALLIQMTCAHKLTDEPLYAQSLDMYQSLFPADEELPKALFLHAVMLKETGEMELAREKMSLIKEKFPDFESQEHFMFEYGYLAHEAGEWEKAYDTFNEYLGTYHDSDNTQAAWKIFFSAALHRVDENDQGYSKEQFYTDIQDVLAIDGLFSEGETNTYKLLFAKTSYELGKYEETYEYLSHLLGVFSDEQSPLHVAEAHYLAAICLYEQQMNHADFCKHLEIALQLDPGTYDKGSTHVHLFNGYLIESGLMESSETANSQLTDKAAEHLYTAITKDDAFIKSENTLWLANHYYKKVKEHTDRHWTASLSDTEELQECAARSQILFEKELLSEGSLKPLDESTLSFEPEALKLADLYSLQGKQQERLSIVTSLLEQQSIAEMDWQYKKHALYELGQTYKALGNPNKALETFNYISTFTTAMPTVMSNSAAYEVARMHYKLLDAQNVSEANEDVLAVLNELKELQIRKNALSEPVHLEAALEYTAIRMELADASERLERGKFFLTRMKEDFSSQADTIGQEYHATLETNAPKKAMYASYMKYVEAEILRLQAEELMGQEKRNECEEVCENALALFEEIKSSTNTPKELYERTLQSIEKVNGLSAY